MRHAIGLALMAACGFAQSGTIEGRITNPATGAGIEGVSVELLSRTDTPKAITDASGSYRFPNVPPGGYGMMFVKEGYYRAPEEAAFAGGPKVTGGSSTHFDAMMLPYLTLRGRVLDRDENPIPKAEISLIPARAPRAVTDEQGRFEFPKLRPGGYRLQATPQSRDFVRTFYPSVIERSQSQEILLRSSTEAGEFDIRLQRAPVYRVSGVVLDESGEPAKDAAVRLIGAADHGIELWRMGGSSITWSVSIRPATRWMGAQIKTDEHGRFEFGAVTEGSWRVQAMSAPFEKIESRNVVSGGGVEIAVSGRDVGDLEIRLAPPFGIEVTSDWGDHEPPREAATPISFVPMDGQPMPAGFEMDPPRYREIVPGRYRVIEFGNSPRGFNLAAVMMGSQDVLDQDIDLSANTPPLRAIYKSGSTAVHIKVEKGVGSAVILIPKSSPQEAKLQATIRMQAVKGESIDLVEVAPGDYAIAVFDRIDRDMLGSQMVLNSIVAGAASLKVESGVAASVELRVSHWAW